MLKQTTLVCFGLLLLLAIGCSKKSDVQVQPPDQQGFNMNDPLLKQILKEGYSLKNIQETQDYYVVEGDILFSKKDHAPASGPQTEQGRSPYIVAPAYRAINVYLNTAGFTSINLNTIVDNVIAAYNAVGSGISMTRVFSPAQAHITIQQNSSIGAGVCGQAGFPFSSGQPFNIVNISQTVLVSNGITSNAQLTQLVAHELGHCLGLRHTNYQALGEPAPIGIPSTPSSDAASVMNGATCGSSWAGFSTNDQTAFRALYNTLGGPNSLPPGTTLLANNLIRSGDGRFNLIMQTDGNLVLYYYNYPLWNSKTNGKPVNRAIMQNDGNLVLYSAANVAYWASNTAGYPGAFAVVQDDGNFVIYQSGIARWASNTSGW